MFCGRTTPFDKQFLLGILCSKAYLKMDIVEKGDSDFIGGSSKIVSLGLDEVNDNADELIEMRGEGRYFGVSDAPSSLICSNCHQRGHKKAQCKTVVCIACGMIDDHYSNQCPKSIVCSNCGEKGHFQSACTQKQRRLYCQTCSSSRHSTDQCPSIWRSYLTKDDDKENKRMGLPNNIYCYNCAEKGHYGDECSERRSSRVPNLDGSAFSGHNLPKNLREKYFNMQKKRKRYESSEDEDDDSVYHGKGTRNRDPKPKSKKNLVEKIKSVFSSKRSGDSNNEPSRKRSKHNNNNQVRKAQSMPVIAGPNKSGFLPPPKGPSSYNYPKNPSSYNSGHNGSSRSYGNGNNYAGGYNNATGAGYSRSGYLEPQTSQVKPTRSGSIGSRFSQKKRNLR